MVRDYGLEIALLQPFRDFEGLLEPLHGLAFARAERKFDLMAELGTDLIPICSSIAAEAQGEINRVVDDFVQLGEIAARVPFVSASRLSLGGVTSRTTPTLGR